MATVHLCVPGHLYPIISQWLHDVQSLPEGLFRQVHRASIAACVEVAIIGGAYVAHRIDPTAYGAIHLLHNTAFRIMGNYFVQKQDEVLEHHVGFFVSPLVIHIHISYLNQIHDFG